MGSGEVTTSRCTLPSALWPLSIPKAKEREKIKEKKEAKAEGGRKISAYGAVRGPGCSITSGP